MYPGYISEFIGINQKFFQAWQSTDSFRLSA